MGADNSEREFTAKDVQAILRTLTGGTEKIGLALLNYYARTNLVFIFDTMLEKQLLPIG